MKTWTTAWGWLLPATLVLALAALGCKGHDGSKGGAAREYDIKGKVVAVDPNKPAVRLDHEDIPGLMEAMEMEFPVAEGKVIEGLKPGDRVQGKVRKDDSGLTITRLEKRQGGTP